MACHGMFFWAILKNGRDRVTIVVDIVIRYCLYMAEYKGTWNDYIQKSWCFRNVKKIFPESTESGDWFAVKIVIVR